MQPVVLHLARVFCFVISARAFTSPWVGEPTPQQREANIDAQLGTSTASKTPSLKAESPGAKAPGSSELESEARNIEQGVLTKVIDKMIPKITAQAEQKAETKWRDSYMQLQESIGTKAVDSSQLESEAHDIEQGVVTKVVEKMIPKITAQAEEKAESKWRESYEQLQAKNEKLKAEHSMQNIWAEQLQAENEKLKAATKSHPVTENITMIPKATDSNTEAKRGKAMEIKEVFPSPGATLVGLLFTAGVSLLMLRSQHISKLIAKHCEGDVVQPLVKSRPQPSLKVDSYVAAGGMQ